MQEYNLGACLDVQFEPIIISGLSALCALLPITMGGVIFNCQPEDRKFVYG